jgi:hypothetical protein
MPYSVCTAAVFRVTGKYYNRCARLARNVRPVGQLVPSQRDTLAITLAGSPAWWGSVRYSIARKS